MKCVSKKKNKNESVARSILERLVEAGLVEPQGIKKGRTYTLSASIYRQLGQSADYIRPGCYGFMPTQPRSGRTFTATHACRGKAHFPWTVKGNLLYRLLIARLNTRLISRNARAHLNARKIGQSLMVRSFHVFWKTRTIHHHPEYRMDTEFPLVREAYDLLRATLRDRNDEILERIYIGRRFKNDTDRPEKLFELYTKMIDRPAPAKKATSRKPKEK